MNIDSDRCPASDRCSRRSMLARSANGFGGLALAALMAEEGSASAARPAAASEAGGIPKGGHHPAKARSVIFLYMDGGPSQIDSFDPKPRLDKEHGQPIKMKTPRTQFNIGKLVMKSPYKFQRHGQCGAPVSDLFPNVARHVDDLAIIRSMVADHSEHTAGNYFLHTGFSMQGRPSMGAWITYGLGSESKELPGFLVLDGGLIPPGGMDCFGSGFLPAAYQASLFRQGARPVADLDRLEPTTSVQRNKLDFLSSLNQGVVKRLGAISEIEATIANYELAYRMQTAVPDLVDLASESKATRDLYGLDDPKTAPFARECLLARRLVERGVRFVELLTPALPGHDRWDQHGGFTKGHRDNSLATDKPIAGLLADLKSRGMLDETLVVWGGEFGRTPCAQGTDGRDHNPFGFTMWMAGGGVKGGTIHGATDEYGYYTVENKVHTHDLHATMLHLLGIDHKKLTYRFSGRDYRLTDVHGGVVHEILS